MARQELLHTHFDMDGVIARTEHLHVKAEIQTCRDNGLDIDESDWLGFKGRPAEDIFTYLVERYGNTKKHRVAALVAQKTNHFLALAETELQPIEGALKFIEEERDRRKTVNLVTSSNKSIQEFIVNSLGIAHLFDHVITGDDIKNGKPHPEPYLSIMNLSGAKPSESLVIEDSFSGIESALAAGCTTMAIATSYPDEELRPTGAIVAKNYGVARVYLDALLSPPNNHVR